MVVYVNDKCNTRQLSPATELAAIVYKGNTFEYGVKHCSNKERKIQQSLIIQLTVPGIGAISPIVELKKF